MLELPQAQFQALFANANRDPQKTRPFHTEDFCFFREKQQNESNFPPVVAAIALALRHEKRCPELLVSCWQQVLEAATTEAKLPETRAYKSDDDKVWVLAPAWEKSNIRGFVIVDGRKIGETVVRDIDRPLLTYKVIVPPRKGAAWIEAGLLLLVSN